MFFHSLGIKGFNHLRWDWSGKQLATEFICRKKEDFKCSVCHSGNVTPTIVGNRKIRASKIGRDNRVLDVISHRIRRHDCGTYRMDNHPFLSHPKSRITLEF
jgi:hypothetical protein